MSVRSGPWSDESHFCLDQVETQVQWCICVFYLGKRWQQHALWEEGKIAEAIFSSYFPHFSPQQPVLEVDPSARMPAVQPPLTYPSRLQFQLACQLILSLEQHLFHLLLMQSPGSPTSLFTSSLSNLHSQLEIQNRSRLQPNHRTPPPYPKLKFL